MNLINSKSECLKKKLMKDKFGISQKIDRYIPNHTHFTFQLLVEPIIAKISKLISDAQLNSQIFKFLHKMSQGYNPKEPETNPFDIFQNTNNFIQLLISKTDNLNTDLIETLNDCYAYDSSLFQNLVQSDPQLFVNLIKAASTKIPEAGKLLFSCFGDQKIAEASFMKLQGNFMSNIRKFQVAIAIKFINIYPILKEQIPEDSVESWLKENKEYLISDLENVNSFYPAIWNSDLFCQVIKITKGDKNIESLNWIHTCPADFSHLSPNGVISKSSAIDLFMSLDKPEYDLSDENTRASYIFLRLFALSFCDPSSLHESSISKLLEYMYDENEVVSSAAMQMVYCWMKKRNYQGTNVMIYKIAEQAMNPENQEKKSYIHLCHVLLTTLAYIYPQAATIIAHEPSLKFVSSDDTWMNDFADIKTGKFIFLHFRKLVIDLDETQIVDSTECLKVIGVIADYFNLI